MRLGQHRAAGGQDTSADAHQRSLTLQIDVELKHRPLQNEEPAFAALPAR
jgi:hypothetical protein